MTQPDGYSTEKSDPDGGVRTSRTCRPRIAASTGGQSGIGAAHSEARQLVSCLMPTADRRRLAEQAISSFLRQDYRSSELIVLDDGRDRIGDLIPSDRRVRYLPLERKVVLGEKRNLACDAARGEILLHWDDDDWHAPNRISYQVGELERNGAAICGTARVLYFEPATQRAWLYEYPGRTRPWISGLCYRKDLWRQNHFPHIPTGEDTRFVWNPRVGTLLTLPDYRFFVGVVHPHNTSRKASGGAWWHPRPVDEVRDLLGEDFAFYEKGWT